MTGGTGTQVESEIATCRAEFALKRYRVDRTKKKISRRVKDGEVPKNTAAMYALTCIQLTGSLRRHSCIVIRLRVHARLHAVFVYLRFSLLFVCSKLCCLHRDLTEYLGVNVT